MVMVIFSLFAPSVLPLLPMDTDGVVAIEIIEEENKQESKKELEEKDVFFESELVSSDFYQEFDDALASYYKLNSSDHAMEIPIPPPEHLG